MSANEKTSLLHRLQIGVGGVFGVLIVLMLADVVLFDTAGGSRPKGNIPRKMALIRHWWMSKIMIRKNLLSIWGLCHRLKRAKAKSPQR